MYINKKAICSLFAIIEPTDIRYQLLQEMVSEKYYESYCAEIAPEPDVFAFLHEQCKMFDLCGACYGITSAQHKRLFSEIYFDDAVENVIHDKFGVKVCRKQVAEVGSLVSCQAPGAGSMLVEMIPWLLWAMGFEYVLITATSQLQTIMRKAKLSFHPICKANKFKLADEYGDVNWGGYYETNPLVGIVDVKSSLHRLIFSCFSEKYDIKKVSVKYSVDTGHIFGIKNGGV